VKISDAAKLKQLITGLPGVDNLLEKFANKMTLHSHPSLGERYI